MASLKKPLDSVKNQSPKECPSGFKEATIVSIRARGFQVWHEEQSIPNILFREGLTKLQL